MDMELFEIVLAILLGFIFFSIVRFLGPIGGVLVLIGLFVIAATNMQEG